ncbi:MAG TPA: glycosyltransferase family 2 protein, partial [Verrucomicrobiota bacterium]|nr:glycosyltransferase family 2 protein [Verrucomicrobiota bacterium]
MKPSVSVIISTQNRAGSLQDTLNSLAGVEVPQGWEAELIVVDNGSTDDTRNVVLGQPSRPEIPSLYVYEARPGKSRALNTALGKALGNVLLFTDDDVRFPPNWISGMCSPIIKGRAEIVQGGIRWAPQLLTLCKSYRYLPRIITSTDHKSKGELAIALIGANMALHRSAFQVVGGFDEQLGPGALGLAEETLVGWQLAQRGFRRLAAFDVQVEHHFDRRRLTRRGLLELAEKRGRSLAYIQHHWEHRQESFLAWNRGTLALKDFIRTVLSPSAWPNQHLVPEWKFSYRANRTRLRQFSIERRRPPNYSK